MKVVEVTTTDNKTRYYLADDTGAPVEPVLWSIPNRACR